MASGTVISMFRTCVCVCCGCCVCVNESAGVTFQKQKRLDYNTVEMIFLFFFEPSETTVRFTRAQLQMGKAFVFVCVRGCFIP